MADIQYMYVYELQIMRKESRMSKKTTAGYGMLEHRASP